MKWNLDENLLHFLNIILHSLRSWYVGLRYRSIYYSNFQFNRTEILLDNSDEPSQILLVFRKELSSQSRLFGFDRPDTVHINEILLQLHRYSRFGFILLFSFNQSDRSVLCPITSTELISWLDSRANFPALRSIIGRRSILLWTFYIILCTQKCIKTCSSLMYEEQRKGYILLLINKVISPHI